MNIVIGAITGGVCLAFGLCLVAFVYCYPGSSVTVISPRKRKNSSILPV